MNKKIGIILLVVTVMLLSACQPTPDKEIVVNKGGDAMQQLVKQTSYQSSRPSSYTVPENWKEDINNENGEPFIEIDAPVTMPDVDKYPVVEVRPGKFSQEQVNKYVSYFAQGKPLKAVSDVLTKSEIKKRIVEEKSSLLLVQKGGTDMPTPEEIQATIDNLEKEYETAPETKDNKTVDPTLTLEPETNSEVLDVNFDGGKEKAAHINVTNCNSEDYYSYFSYDNFIGSTLYQPAKSLYGKNASGLKTTPEEAGKEAREVIDKLGLSNYTVDIVETGTERDLSKQGYRVTCRPVLDDVTVLYCEGRDMTNVTADGKAGNLVDKNTGAEVDFGPSWGRSEIWIYIDDTGVISLRWFNPIETLKEENSGVSIKPFKDIQDIFSQQIKSTYIWSENKNNSIVHIDSIRLGLAAIPEKNNQGGFLLVPAWVFSGYTEYPEMSKNSGLGYDLMNNRTTTAMVLNAVDGTLIH